MLKNPRLKPKRPQQLTATIAILIVAIVGTIVLTGSRAATPYASVNAGSGILTGEATKQSDGSVQFGTTSTGSNQGVPFIGIDGINGWGPALSSYMLNDGFKWDRSDVTGGGYSGAGNDVDDRLASGANVIIILPTDTNEAMSWMNAYKSYGSRVMFEFWNEPWTSSNGPAAIPVATYTQEYEAAYTAKHNAGITQPLLFMTCGDQDGNSSGSTWLAEAKKAVPNLQVDAFSDHPYGQANQSDGSHTYGVNAIAYQHNEAVNLGFTDTPWYITEFGFTIKPSQSGDGAYAPSYAQQAADLTAAYKQLITYGDGVSGTWLKGIQYYGAHDDSTGWWGLITAPVTSGLDAAGEPGGTVAQTSPTPVLPRPAYTALKAFLTNH